MTLANSPPFGQATLWSAHREIEPPLQALGGVSTLASTHLSIQNLALRRALFHSGLGREPV